jgi:hypothetical protein
LLCIQANALECGVPNHFRTVWYIQELTREIETISSEQQYRTMTPEEFDRRMEFILDSQAAFAASQEHDHELVIKGFQSLTNDVAELRESTARFQSFAAELITIQSERMDRMDKFHAEVQQQVIDLQRQTLHLLNLILERLLPKSDNPS